jgi:hypothetical protein
MESIFNNEKYKTDTFLTNELQQIRKKFVPEQDIELIPFDYILFKQFFPFNNKKCTNINLSKYQITNIGKYSMTDLYTSKITSNIIYEYFTNKFNQTDIIITDATANMGGDTISFANKFSKVNSVEIIYTHYSVMSNNINVACVDNVTPYWANYLDIADKLKNDIVFIDAPWGGKSYKDFDKMDLYLDNINVKEIAKLLLQRKICKMVVLKVPVNYNTDKLDIFEYYIKDIKNRKEITKYKLILLFIS